MERATQFIGRSAFWATFNDGEKANIMNITNKTLLMAALCFLIGRTAPTQAVDLNPITLGSAPGYAAGLVLRDGYAYVASRGAGLRVIDVHNPANLRQVGLIGLGGDAWSLSVTGDYAHVDNGNGGMAVVDVSDPFVPRLITAFPPDDPDFARTAPKRVASSAASVHGKYQLNVDDDDGLTILDIHKPSLPTRVGGFYYEDDGIGLEAYSVARSGNLVYVGDTERLTVIDISRRANPQRRGSISDEESFGGVAASGNFAYVGTFRRVEPIEWVFNVFDIRHPAKPKKVASVLMANEILDIKISGHHAFVANYDGLQVVDISNPTNPVVFPPTPNIPFGFTVAISGNLACVASGQFGMSVVDISDPAHAQLASIYRTNGSVNDVAVRGNVAYTANDTEGLEVIDISTPANPLRVGRYGAGGTAVVVTNNYAYLGGQNFLKVIDIRDPANPHPVGAASTESTVRSMVINGKYAYTAHYHGGVSVYDISDPTNPHKVGGNTSFDAWSVAVHKNKILATGDSDTLTILKPFHRK